MSENRSDSFFFFFQAEDGIRDKLVTGVQTCALPIFLAGGIVACAAGPHGRRIYRTVVGNCGRCWGHSDSLDFRPVQIERSEERRVGKECRSRWSTYFYKERKWECLM